MSGRLLEHVEINRRFARSARLDADLNGTPPLVGYVMQASVERSLETLAASQIDSAQGAFTWTGPYGGGKSSAALLLANVIGGSATNKAIARDICGTRLTNLIDKAFPQRAKSPWAIAAVTGSRSGLREAIVNACSGPFAWPKEICDRSLKSDEHLIGAITNSADGRSGVLLVLDELGKLLEQQAAEGGDIHLLQDLAERSSRSGGRIVIVGILHQAFEQYAARVSRGARDEWAKVQGRFQDIPFLAAADETIALLGQAISAPHAPKSARACAEAVAAAVAKRKPIDEQAFAGGLEKTWPLNPVTALLLGPVSRQRFAQNERSVFGFLSSAEPSGFQDFLKTATTDDLYGPDKLWDYLASNFGMSLASGVDGGKFSLAFEAIERAAAKGNALHVKLTKAAAAIEFFRNGSGLAVADDFLTAATPDVSKTVREVAIADLVAWAVLVRQPRLSGYALFAGSDFDLEDAIKRSTGPMDPVRLQTVAQHAGIGFVPAKRHYFKTGALRTFAVRLVLVGAEDSVETLVNRIIQSPDKASGSLALLVSDGSLSHDEIEKKSKLLAKQILKSGQLAAVGGAKESFSLRTNVSEYFALERVLREYPQLEGDRIARRELAARRSMVIDAIHRDIETALDNTRWHLSSDGSTLREPVAVVASGLADTAFYDAPILRSELLQREKPSSNAMAALRELCYAMVQKPDQKELGFVGFPAAMGLYLTILGPLGLHGADGAGHYGFREPSGGDYSSSLLPAWKVMVTHADQSLLEVYTLWAKAPIGLKAGPMPILALAYILANKERFAVYVDGVFQTELNDLFVDRLLQKPEAVRLRQVDRSVRESAFLGGLAERLGVKDAIAALPVAQALFRRYESLSTYAKRSDSLSEIAKAVRSVVLKSRDPEALLFDDLPTALGGTFDPSVPYTCLLEAEQAYPGLLLKIRQALAKSLALPSNFEGIAERAATIRELTNDYSFEAFVMRVSAFEGGGGDIEGIASLLLHKPAHSWTDRDREQALLQLARFGRQFRELEALAVVRDRRSSTEALAVVVGVDPKIAPLMRSFVLTDPEKREATVLADELLAALRLGSNEGRIRMAALARAVASLAAETSEDVL